MSQRNDYLLAQGFLTDSEANFLHAVAGEAQFHEGIFNIGVEYGKSVVALAAGIVSREVGLYCVDIDLSKFDPRRLYEQDLLATSFTFVQVQSSRAPTPRHPTRILFVDGDHTYEGVKLDTLWAERVEVGGLAIFHDCWQYGGPSGVVHSACPGVNKAVEEWIEHTGWFWDEMKSVDSMRIFRRMGEG